MKKTISKSKPKEVNTLNNKLLSAIKKVENYTTTENGDLAFNSTNNCNLDFFSRAGAMRGTDKKTIISLFSKAFAEDSKLALKSLFYLRDVRGGQGERQLFRDIITHLANTETKRIAPLVKLIPEYGRWDDLIVLLDTPLKQNVINCIAEQLVLDTSNPEPSIMAKWLPSCNTSSDKTKQFARLIIKELGINEKEYRQILSTLRARIDVVERKMSLQKWGDIVYERVPSKAQMNYRNAFKKRDGTRYTKYLDNVTKGKQEIKAGTLYPYELYRKVVDDGYNITLEEQWKALPNYVKAGESALVMADVSGSMTAGSSKVTPISVSVSLALYFAERNKGPFANHFLTFSGNPKLQEIIGTTLYDKIVNIKSSDWEMNTDLRKAIQTILDIAKINSVTAEDMPKTLYIISDMQFDSCCGSSTFTDIKAEYKKYGYQFPQIVFWNVNGSYENSPITTNDKGAQLVSGFSPILFKQVVSGKTAVELMYEILNSKRYKEIK